MEEMNEEETVEAVSENEGQPKKEKGKKGKKGDFDPLKDKMKFKKIDFENALTPEEKAAKKAEKEAAKKGKKPKKSKQPLPPTEDSEIEAEGEMEVATEVKQGEIEKSDKKEKIDDGETQEEEETEKKKTKGKKAKEDEKPKKEKKEKPAEKEKKEKGKEEKEKEGKQKGKQKKDKEKATSEEVEKGISEAEEETEVKSKTEADEKLEKKKSETEPVEDDKKAEKGKKKGKEKGKKSKKITESMEELEDKTISQPTLKVPEEDEWSWYSCSCSQGEEEEVEEEEVKVKQKKKDKKKDKKKKKEAKEEEKKQEEQTAPPEEDFMAEIKKMQAIAMGQEVTEEKVEEVKPKKPKQPKKPKVPKPPKPVKMTDAMRKQLEEEEKRRAEEERIRIEQERLAAIAKEKRENLEHILRMEQLENSISLRQQITEHYINEFVSVKEDAEWDHYLRCDGLPYALNVAQMNTYMELWGRYLKMTDREMIARRIKDALQLLEFLTEYIEFPIDATTEKIENWKWVKDQLREIQHESIDRLTCNLTKNIKEKMKRIDKQIALFVQEEESFAICIYAFVALPQPLPNPRRPPRVRLEIEFDMLKQMTLIAPEDLDPYLYVIRGMYLKYDHFSDTCETFLEPKLPEILNKDLKQTTFLEHFNKQFYKFENRVQLPPKQLAEDEEPPPEPEVNVENGIVPKVPYQKLEPTASEYFLSTENVVYEDILNELMVPVSNDEVVNLRRYIVIGGIFFLNLFYQPPQPKELPNLEIIVAITRNPVCVRERPFYVEYIPPPPPAPGMIRLPEEIEAEMKKQEEEFDKLLFINMNLPDHVLWLDPPFVCRWEYDNKQWTTKDIHDVKFIEEKNSISFRSGRFGTFSLAINKFCNLPYQTWEIKPEKDGSVSLQITAAIIYIEFNVKEKMVCMSKLQNCPTKAMTEHLGIYYKLPKLIRILKEGGIDVFPDHDSFIYVEGGHCQKHWPLEYHTYYNVAEIAGVFNIAWSRWNFAAGRRNIIFQIRDYDVDKVKQVPFNLISVNPLGASYINCAEVSSQLNLVPIEGSKFYADLFYLIRGTTRMAVRTKIQTTPLDLVAALANLLTATRVFSWS